jgi:hypothetical protein
VATYGITPIPNFIIFRPSILILLEAHKHIPIVKRYVRLGWVRLCYVCGAHAQWITGNGVIIIPPQKFKQPSRRYCQMYEFKKY